MKIKKLLALPLVALSLTGCATKISPEKFMEGFNAAKDNLAQVETTPENVVIRDGDMINTTRYDYKAGEFYHYHYFVIILIVPVKSEIYTWKEDGKFYHAEEFAQSSKDFLKEITESEFLSYMDNHRATINSKLREPLNSADNLLSENPEGYVSVKNSFYSPAKGAVELRSSTKYIYHDSDKDQDVEKSGSVTVTIKNSLPTYWYTKNSSKSKWHYSYGNAKFTKPEIGGDE